MCLINTQYSAVTEVKNMPSGRLDRRVKYTKMMLKNSIVELLGEKPIEKVTVKEICERADVNRGTFYSHYSDQFDLYNSIVDELLNGIFERLGDILRAGQQSMLKSVTLVYDYIKENSKLVEILLDGRIKYGIDARINEIVESIYLHDIKKSAENRTEIDAAYSFIASANLGIIKYWLSSGMKMSVEEMAALSIKLSYNGISALL